MKQVMSIMSCMLIGLFLSAQTVQWTWMGGDSTVNHMDSVNKPGSRSPVYTWTDKAGNFYMFAGDAVTNPLLFKDYQPVLSNRLWKYNSLSNSWTTISGENSMVPNIDISAVFGTPGVPAPGNTPGSTRSRGASWVDQFGNFWLYGGKTGARAFGTNSDLWKFDPIISQWTFISGNGTDVFPNYGIKGIPDPSNHPGARTTAVSWTDNKGNLYLYGGYLQNAIAPNFGDVWKYDMAAKLWTWVSGKQWDRTKQEQPVYGSMGIFAPENTPGSAVGTALQNQKDSSGIISISINNEIWNYSLLADQWAWISGNRNTPQPVQARIYGVKGVPSDTSNPGTRGGYAIWTDSIGNSWLFGGIAKISNLQNGYFNDLWKYTAQTHQWTWVAGDSTANKAPTYGIKGIAADSNQPGGRSVSAVWKDAKGNMWLYGGSPRAREVCCIISWYDDVWKLSGTREAALPVKLSSFTAQKQQRTALLKWTTAQEQNSDYFIVERSTDLASFNFIGKVHATGSGSSYSLSDGNPARGNNYYRLKEVDKDGHVEYAQIVTVNFDKQNSISLFPNPVTNTLRITGMPGNQPLQVQIIDIAGNLVYNKVHSGSQISIHVSNLSNGFYIVRAGDQIGKLVIKR